MDRRNKATGIENIKVAQVLQLQVNYDEENTSEKPKVNFLKNDFIFFDTFGKTTAINLLEAPLGLHGNVLKGHTQTSNP